MAHDFVKFKGLLDESDAVVLTGRLKVEGLHPVMMSDETQKATAFAYVSRNSMYFKVMLPSTEVDQAIQILSEPQEEMQN
ncbi:MAG TPA: hypothetical protein VEA59_06730 [Patescibacteria group bacterium]|nr:hypothetical protein [Patescibacteria group bacterium]